MKLLSHSSPIFPVDNPLETAEYYRDVLGFDINFKWEDPTTYVVINRDDAVGIHLVKKEHDFQPSSMHPSLFILSTTWMQCMKNFRNQEPISSTRSVTGTMA